ncbi:STAS domain-containing protein [Streptomyces sp. NPDC056269]|uniref:STAS domain-containing protein n=1 Tax=Streptomyces sp. NPDC056269 TaxID=3345768 RepID=UPI0035DF28AA
MSDPASSTHDGLLVVHSPLPDRYVLTLRGTADSRAFEDLEDDFARATNTGLPLVVDLAALEFGDGALLGLLLKARRGKRHPRRTDLRLLPTPPRHRRRHHLVHHLPPSPKPSIAEPTGRRVPRPPHQRHGRPAHTAGCRPGQGPPCCRRRPSGDFPSCGECR